MAGVFNRSNMKKTVNYLKRNGIRQAYYAARERMESVRESDYRYEPPTEEEIRLQKEKSASLIWKFSILVPAYETPEEYLQAMVDSVLAQTYGKFELIIADASESDRVERVMASYHDSRILYRRIKHNGGISANTNQALMYATGDYAALLDHDDLLTPDALYEVALQIKNSEEKNIELQMLYSDEDKYDAETLEFCEVHRKEKFNLDLIMSNNYICHFLVMKRQLMQELGFRSVCDGAQDFDLVLRAIHSMLGKDKRRETVKRLPIAHVPRVLYHWRCHESSTARNPASKGYAYDAGKRAVEDFLRARGWKGSVSHLRHLGFYRVDYEPDIFTNRPDVGVVGGKLTDGKNRVAGGIYTKEGQPLYQGLHREYSGYMHRAALQQEAELIDIRCMKASPAAKEIWEELMGLPYLENPVTGRLDYRECLKKDADYLDISRKLCERLRARNMRIVWEPSMVEKIG